MCALEDALVPSLLIVTLHATDRDVALLLADDETTHAIVLSDKPHS